MLVNKDGKPVSSFKVGSIFISLTNENPSSYLGGTWVRFGKGRTLVGIDENDKDTNSKINFNQKPETKLGSKYLQSHNHQTEYRQVVSGWNGNMNDNFPIAGGGVPSAYGGKASSSTGEGDSQNVQPSIMVYFWKRTA